MSEIANYWIVIRERGGMLFPAASPATHDSPEFAKREAKRLASENPGQRFYVFEAVGVAHKPDPVVWMEKRPLDDDGVPF